MKRFFHIIIVGISAAYLSGSYGYAQNGFGFTGQDADTSTQLVFLRARQYDPETGVFLSRDPLGVNGGLNTYTYVASDPINGIDPQGTVAFWDTVVAAGVGAAVGAGGRFIGDAINVSRGGEWSSKAQYAGSAAGGAAFGAALTVNPFGASAAATAAQAFVAGALSGAVSSTMTQGLNIRSGSQTSFSGKALAAETITSAALSGGFAAAGNVVRAQAAALGPAFNTLKGNVGEAVGTLVNLSKGNIANPTKFQSEHAVTDSVLDMVTLTGKIFEFKSVWKDNGIGAILTPARFSKLSSAQKQTATLEGANYVAQQVNMAYAIPVLSAGVGFGLGESAKAAGVLIDKAATLVGSNLADIKGATYDPVSNQIVFLGSNSTPGVEGIDMDYFFTAVKAVYGSAVPPFVSLDSPASATTLWMDLGDGDGNFEPGEYGGFDLRYRPLWSGEDTNVAVRLRCKIGTTAYDFRVNFTPQPLS
jgi:RHS repeat-associated protein